MPIVVDASVIVACILDEPTRAAILKVTSDQSLVAPASLPWEIGNAFSAMFKKRSIELEEAISGLKLFRLISIDLHDIDAAAALRLCHRHHIYAYDAYVLQCAIQAEAPMLTLDTGLMTAAKVESVPLLQVRP